MKLLLYFCFVVINFYSLFYFSPTVQRKPLLIGAVTSLVVILLGAITYSYINRDSNVTNTIAFSIYVSTLIIIIMLISNQMFFGIVDGVIGFYKQNNALRIDRNPIKMLIKHQNSLKRRGTYIWFFTSLIMLYGVWFGKKNL